MRKLNLTSLEHSHHNFVSVSDQKLAKFICLGQTLCSEHELYVLFTRSDIMRVHSKAKCRLSANVCKFLLIITLEYKVNKMEENTV